MIEIDNLRTLNATRKRHRYVLIDFYAPWCVPCRKLTPILEELEKRYTNVVFCKVNVQTVNLTRFKLGTKRVDITHVPTLMLFRENSRRYELSGMNVPEIIATLNSLLSK